MAELALRIRGMDCAEEVQVLQRELGSLPGVESLRFDLINQRMIVVHAPERIGVDELKSAVGRTGMTAELWKASELPRPESLWTAHGRTMLTVLSGLLIL